MSSIYSIVPAASSGAVALSQVWTQGATGGIAAGCTAMAQVVVGSATVLFAYNKATQKTTAYTLSAAAPWVNPVPSTANLSGGPWDLLTSFVLGNEPYLLTYRGDNGTFGFYKVAADLSVSAPYPFVLPRNTPTKGFTTVGAFTAINQQFVLGYDFATGQVAIFSVVVTPTSIGGVPPLLALDVWYHQWAQGWTHFAFFQLGSANFFFKINTAKLNVNIDHIQDTPSLGTVEVGSYLQAQLPDALVISATAAIPWADGEPYLLTYIASSGSTAVYRIHGDCQGWSSLNASVAEKGASLVVSYRVAGTSYALLYQG